MQAEDFFSAPDKARIAEAVRLVEMQTAGEVVAMVVDESDTYPEGRILAGGALGGLLALVVSDVFLADSLWWFVPLALGLTAFCGWLIAYLPAAHRLFVHPTKLEERVTEQALLAFYRHGLQRTKDATGVLFFISLFERKVRVMADQGIYTKISQETLQQYADNVATGVKNGSAAEALCREIARVGLVLTEHFPIKSDDTNELSNEVIVGR
ncbi:MAG: hypothetical protein HGA96_13360 [Desulfobulbaceae bacterium]|nr:hypothetical protein [Desulfobulbaceae bacterium]